MTQCITDQDTLAIMKVLRIITSESNSRLFVTAKNGVRFHPQTLSELRMTKRQFYNALAQLKTAGLVEKYGDAYFHTTFGEIVYQQDIVQLSKYQMNMREMRIIDSLKHVDGISKTDIDKFASKVLEESTGKSEQNNISSIRFANGVAVSSSSPETGDLGVELFSSYDQILARLAKLIDDSCDEILIATRVSPAAVIKQLIDKAKVGVKIKVLADINLTRSRLKINILTKGSDPTKTAVTTTTTKNAEKCYKIVTDSWWPHYRDFGIDAKLTKIPFGMIILDTKIVGMEIVDSYKPKEFTQGLVINDTRMANMMKSVFQRMSDEALDLEDAPSSNTILTE